MKVVTEFCFKEDTELTVFKTSIFFSGDGFSVYDSSGEVLLRVESYDPGNRDNEELVLMDLSGKCLLTVRRKKRSLHHRWEGFVGERSEGQKPVFSVRRSSMFGGSSLTIEVYENPGEEYHIEGSYRNRCCKVRDTSGEIVAEIKRKMDVSANLVLGKDVFTLCLKAGFDGAFAMALVLILDQISGDYGEEDVEPIYLL